MSEKGLLAGVSIADEVVDQIRTNYEVNGVLIIPVAGDLRETLAEALNTAREQALDERADEITNMIESVVGNDDSHAHAQ